MITYKKGDLLEYFRNKEVCCLLHVTNCQGVMGSGIALQIKNQFPEAYDAYKHQEDVDGGLKLGSVSIGMIGVDQAIFNLNAQHLYGHGDRHLNYEQFYICLERVKNWLNFLQFDGSIGIPSKMGSDRAGGAWSIVKAMVDEVFKDHDVLIVEYDTSAQSIHSYIMDCLDAVHL